MLRRLRQPENIALIIALAALVIAPVFCHFSMRLEPYLNDVPEAEFTFQPPLIFPQVVSWGVVLTTITLVVFLVVFSFTSHSKSEPSFPPTLATLCFAGEVVLIPCGALLLPRSMLEWSVLVFGLAGIGAILYVASQLSRYSRMGLPVVIMGCASALLALSAAWVTIFPLYELSDQVEFRNQTYSLIVKSYEIGDSEYDMFYAVVSCDSIGWQCRALWRGNYDTLVREIAGGLMIYSISLESEANRIVLRVERAGSTVEIPLELPA